MSEWVESKATHYSGGAIFLHWLIAAALAGQIALGFGMPDGPQGFALVQLHKSIGIVILLLSLVRLGWRLTHAHPPRAEGGLNGLLASAVHWGLYAFMILAPLTGWALVSTAPVDIPTLLFGTIPWPDLPISGGNELWEESHELLAFFGLALFGLHVAGALRHHFLLRDGLLGRIAPGGVPRSALLLGAGVVAIGLVSFLASGTGERIEARGAELARQADAVDMQASEESEDAAPGPEDEATGDDEAALDEPSTEDQAEEDAQAAEASAGPPPRWAIQPGGALRFAIDYSGSPLRGSFGNWTGDIVFDPQDPTSAEIAMRIDLSSATMGDATQDQMLHGADYLGGGAATWNSGRVTKTGANSYRAEGTLSLKGVSRSQPISFTLGGSGNRRAVSGSASIDHRALGVAPDASDLGARVALDFTFDAVKQ